MNIQVVTEYSDELLNKVDHVLTMAETGFSPLAHFRDFYNVDRGAVDAFEERINESDEPGSLYPKAPVSAIPRKYVKEAGQGEGLKQHIKDFLAANNKKIKAKKLLISFSTCVDSSMVEDVKEALESSGSDLEEVIIVQDKD